MINSTDKETLYNYALALKNLQKYDESIEYFDKALSIDPLYVNALNGKGRVLHDLQNYDEAL